MIQDLPRTSAGDDGQTRPRPEPGGATRATDGAGAQPALGPAVRAAAVLARPRLGWAAAGLGVIALLIGWAGTADEVFVSRQVPFLISGGLGGLGLIVIGGVLLATHDLYGYAERLDRVERKVDDIHRALVAAGPLDVPAEEPASEVVVLPRGSTYHRAGCAAVQGKDTERLDALGATRDGLSPCKLCSPDGRVATAT